MIDNRFELTLANMPRTELEQHEMIRLIFLHSNLFLPSWYCLLTLACRDSMSFQYSLDLLDLGATISVARGDLGSTWESTLPMVSFTESKDQQSNANKLKVLPSPISYEILVSISPK